MAGAAPRSTLEILRDDPVETALYTVGPVVALVQLLNSAVNGLSLFVSVPFAVVLFAFTAIALAHRISQARLARLDVEGAASRID